MHDNAKIPIMTQQAKTILLIIFELSISIVGFSSIKAEHDCLGLLVLRSTSRPRNANGIVLLWFYAGCGAGGTGFRALQAAIA